MHSGTYSINSENVSDANRAAWVDLCRVAAMFGVVIIHACIENFYKYNSLPLHVWLSTIFLDSLARPCVPLFAMLTGALLLHRRIHSFVEILARIRRLLLPLIVWSVFYLLYSAHIDKVAVDWWSLIRKQSMYHLWYAWLLVGLYITLPVLQVLFHAMMRSTYLKIYILALWFIIHSLPIYMPTKAFSSMLLLIEQKKFLGYGGYLLLGGVLAATPLPRVSSRVLFGLYMLGVTTTFMLTWGLSYQANQPIVKASLYHSPNIILMSIASFILFTRARISGSMAHILSWIAEKCFFIYFVHVFLLEYIRSSQVILDLAAYMPNILVVLIIAVSSFLGSLILASAVRLIPGSKHVFG